MACVPSPVLMRRGSVQSGFLGGWVRRGPRLGGEVLELLCDQGPIVGIQAQRGAWGGILNAVSNLKGRGRVGGPRFEVQ